MTEPILAACIGRSVSCSMGEDTSDDECASTGPTSEMTSNEDASVWWKIGGLVILAIAIGIFFGESETLVVSLVVLGFIVTFFGLIIALAYWSQRRALSSSHFDRGDDGATRERLERALGERPELNRAPRVPEGFDEFPDDMVLMGECRGAQFMVRIRSITKMELGHEGYPKYFVPAGRSPAVGVLPLAKIEVAVRVATPFEMRIWPTRPRRSEEGVGVQIGNADVDTQWTLHSRRPDAVRRVLSDPEIVSMAQQGVWSAAPFRSGLDLRGGWAVWEAQLVRGMKADAIMEWPDRLLRLTDAQRRAEGSPGV